MLQLTCHCGRTRIELQEPPDYINECNCTLCNKTGARWAYFHPSKVDVDGLTSTYVRTDKAEPGACVQFCPTCGVTTHFTLTAGAIARHGDVMRGVNMRLADESDLAGIELRFPDGLAWPGTGEFSYVRPSRIIGDRC